MHLLPHLHVNVVSLFGLTLLLGLLGGELAARLSFLPRISGYLAVGFLLGPNCLNMVTPSLLAGSHIFVDISLGLILFTLGRHLDLRWIRHDKSVLHMAIVESTLTFLFIFALFIAFNFTWLQAALTATIAVATSPAVVMMVADDLNSKGPVTRRTLILTSLNNLFALFLFTILLPMTQSLDVFDLSISIGYRLCVSIFLGIVIFAMTLGIAYFIGKKKEQQFILLVGSVMFAIGVSDIFKLSFMLTLFTMGVMARNLNYQRLLMEVKFGWFAKIFFILLFVITGSHLQIKGLWETTAIVFAFILLRALAKGIGVWTFAKSSQLTFQQTWALCFALIPMAGLAVGMSNVILYFNPNLGNELITIIASGVAILNIIGPIAVQIALKKSNNTFHFARE
jgi:Kef-type K+ transport system membrane component KefB